MFDPLNVDFPVLIGDIGGTNARFQILEDNTQPPTKFDTVRTANFDTIEDAVSQTILKGASQPPKSIIIAAAGPITKAGLNLTNCHWDIDPKNFLELAPFDKIILMNDFEAQALSLPVLDAKDGCVLGEATQADGIERTKAVLGPGTGLGVGLLVRAGEKWVPVAGEGGHVDLGPRTGREADIWQNLETVDGRISAEQIVCGAGLVNLYNAICKTDGRAPTLSEAAGISSVAVTGDDAQAVEALSIFCITLGRIAGDLALTSMATGGVYIAGGIAQKILPFLQKSGFRSAFEDKAPHGALMRRISTLVVTHPLPALLGLAAYAKSPGSYAIDIQHRCWSR